MKTLFLLLLAYLTSIGCFAQTGDSTETFEPAPYQLRFQSFEVPQATGSLVLPLVIDAQRDLETVGHRCPTGPGNRWLPIHR